MILYCTEKPAIISTPTSLQHDLDTLVGWSSTSQMNFHPMKCYHLRISRKKIPLDTHYTMLGHTLQRVDHNPYLGVEFSSDLSWNNHIKKVTSKAQRALGFVRRNLSSTPRPVKVHRALIRPTSRICCSRMGSIHTEEHQGAGDGPETCSPICCERGTVVNWKHHVRASMANNGASPHCLQAMPSA